MARALIDAKIAENAVMVFSKTYCPFCTKAKRALQSLLQAGQMGILEVRNWTHIRFTP